MYIIFNMNLQYSNASHIIYFDEKSSLLCWFIYDFFDNLLASNFFDHPAYTFTHYYY